MKPDDFRLLIESGDVNGLRQALEADPTLANQTIHWVLNQQNHSDPLHYVSDCVAHGWLKNGKEGAIAASLLAYGAAIEGSEDKESPLIAAASSGAERVAKVLVEAGAALERTSIFGARALHWAAWTGSPSTVALLISHGAQLEAKCTKFEATPLFWAVHGCGPDGPRHKHDQIGAARLLIEAGASIDTRNRDGLSAVELSRLSGRQDLYDLCDSALSVRR